MYVGEGNFFLWLMFFLPFSFFFFFDIARGFVNGARAHFYAINFVGIWAHINARYSSSTTLIPFAHSQLHTHQMTEIKNDYSYHPGFGNHFSSEALPDSLPKGIMKSFGNNCLTIRPWNPQHATI